MVLPLLASLVYFVWLADHPAARIVYAGAKAFTFAWPLVAAMWIMHERLPRLRVAEAFNPKAMIMGVLSGALIAGVILLLMNSPIGDLVAGNSDNIRAKVVAFGLSEHYLAFALFLSLFHSLIEEYYWRWFVYGRLRRLIRIQHAHLLAGLAFASHHIVIASQFFTALWALALGACVALGGIFWSLMYERQKTIVGAWISHMIVDLSIMAIGYRLVFM